MQAIPQAVVNSLVKMSTSSNGQIEYKMEIVVLIPIFSYAYKMFATKSKVMISP
jgi:hypothetical protein